MSAKPTNPPPATTQQQNKPPQAAPNAQQSKPNQPPAQQKPTQSVPKAAITAVVLPDATAAKALLRTKFTNLFQTDAEFASLNVDSIIAQGMRFKMERGIGTLTTHFIPILKFGGLLKPGLLWSKSTFASKKIELYNVLNQKVYLTFQQQADKSWEVKSTENNNSVIGIVKVSQNNTKRFVQLFVNNTKSIECNFECPVQKSGCCAAPRPANLNSIQFTMTAPGPDIEENPNGDVPKDSLEINCYYRLSRAVNELNLYVPLLQIAAFELK
jgi:hypothetical protein